MIKYGNNNCNFIYITPYFSKKKIIMENQFVARRGIISQGSVTFPQVTINGTYTVTKDDYLIDISGGTFTVTLPTAVGIQGKLYVIKNNGGGNVTVQTVSGQTIDDVTSLNLGATNSISIASNGSKLPSKPEISAKLFVRLDEIDLIIPSILLESNPSILMSLSAEVAPAEIALIEFGTSLASYPLIFKEPIAEAAPETTAFTPSFKSDAEIPLSSRVATIDLTIP